jgi:hypothetical protein
MRKIFFVLLFFTICVQSLIHAGITGATRWVKDNKTVYIYFDDHCTGSVQENAVHFEYIRENVIEKTEVRNQPLLMLVENYMREPRYRDLVRNIELFSGDKHRFLQLFDEWVDRELPNSIFIRSFEARVVPFLTFPLFCEWQRRSKQHPKFSDQLYVPLDAAFATLTFGEVFAMADRINEHVQGAPDGSVLRSLFVKQKRAMQDLIDEAKTILYQGGFSDDEIIHRPIKEIWNELVTLPRDHSKMQAWDIFFIYRHGQDFWTGQLLWQLTNANMLRETINFNGNVAIFTGCYHAISMEECLRRLGYSQTGAVNMYQVEMERDLFAYEDGVDSDTELDLVSLSAYDWMQ